MGSTRVGMKVLAPVMTQTRRRSGTEQRDATTPSITQSLCVNQRARASLIFMAATGPLDPEREEIDINLVLFNFVNKAVIFILSE